jgi:hypothetical protein
MEIKNLKITNVLPLIEGTSAKGTWKKQTIVGTWSVGNYDKTIAFDTWNDKVEMLQVGDVATVTLDVSSREHNGKWYTDIRAWKVQKQSNNEPPFEL